MGGANGDGKSGADRPFPHCGGQARVRAFSQLGHEAAATLSDVVEASETRRVDVVAWRDLDDPEAGGSELHAHEVLSRWAAAGVDVRLWTSRVDGAARTSNAPDTGRTVVRAVTPCSPPRRVTP